MGDDWPSLRAPINSRYRLSWRERWVDGPGEMMSNTGGQGVQDSNQRNNQGACWVRVWAPSTEYRIRYPQNLPIGWLGDGDSLRHPSSPFGPLSKGELKQ